MVKEFVNSVLNSVIDTIMQVCDHKVTLNNKFIDLCLNTHSVFLQYHANSQIIPLRFHIVYTCIPHS